MFCMENMPIDIHYTNVRITYLYLYCNTFSNVDPFMKKLCLLCFFFVENVLSSVCLSKVAILCSNAFFFPAYCISPLRFLILLTDHQQT
jgi:hypothetical protein